jgi:hypothetical protein
VLKVTIGVALLLLVALVGARRTFTWLHLPRGARLVLLTGTEFILVGVALGDQLIGILDEPTVRSLTPLFSLGLGVAGLLFGLQLDVEKILRFPSRYLVIAGLQAVTTMLVVFWPCRLFLESVLGGEGRELLLASWVLAATAACTAQTALALVDRELGLRGARVMGLLRYVSSIDAVVGLVVLGVAFCLAQTRPVAGLELAVGLQWLAVSLGIGGGLGLLLQLLTMVRCRDEELLLFVVGLVVFGSGAALYLGVSPLFVTLVMGALVGNRPGARDRIFLLLSQLEKPVYVVFLILAGAIWRPGSSWALPLAGLYLGLRAVGKLGGGYLAARIAGEELRAPPWLGLGLLSQGGIVIAMVMSYYGRSASPMTDVVVTAVLIAVIANELASPALATRVLRAAGEVRE